MLNIPSVNMPKIKPETCWLLIIKTLKSKSLAEVTDIFNVSKRQVKWIRKCYQDTGDVHGRPRSGQTTQDNWSRRQLAGSTVKSHASQLQEEWMPVAPVLSRTRNGLHGHIAAQKPALNKTAKKPCCTPRPTAWRKVGQQKSGKKLIFQMNRQLSSIPSAANIDDDPQGPVWTHGSPRRQSNLEVERLWFGVTSNTEVPRRSVRWMVTLIVPNINRLLPPSTFPTTSGVRFFNRMELLAIPQVPLCSFSGGRRSGSFRDGQHSLQIWILLSISGEEWRRKLGGPSRRTWRSFGVPARWPSMPPPQRLHQQALRLSAKPDGNCSAGQRNPYKILIT